MPARALTRDDVMPLAAYLAIRKAKRQEMAALKRKRRVEVGPFATFYFESWDTMWFQVHEMLAIERGGEEQITDELAAYAPLVPNGTELVATVMFEIDDPIRRKAALSRIGGIEHTMFLTIGSIEVPGQSEEDVDRTNAAGKASSVQFVHFPLTPEAAAAFKQAGTQVIVGFRHPAYAHMAVMPEAVRAALSADLD